MTAAQTNIDAAVAHLKQTNTSYSSMSKRYGADPAKWPATSQWFLALTALAAARKAAGSPLTAAFSFKES